MHFRAKSWHKRTQFIKPKNKNFLFSIYFSLLFFPIFIETNTETRPNYVTHPMSGIILVSGRLSRFSIRGPDGQLLDLGDRISTQRSPQIPDISRSTGEQIAFKRAFCSYEFDSGFAKYSKLYQETYTSCVISRQMGFKSTKALVEEKSSVRSGTLF